VSYSDSKHLGVTVSAVGPWSEQVVGMQAGELLGILGPYGNGFKLTGKKIVLVGGGYGTASLMLLAEKALRKKVDVTLIVGARSEKYLLYRDRIKALGLNAIFTTDDGSFGEAGYNTDALEQQLKKGGIDTVYTCGPEMMEKRVAEICRDSAVACQVSLERHMKCGFGVCGACCMDSSGMRVCVEGPVLSGEEVLGLEEFGKYHRDSGANKHYF
ncbi:dihydroorotate dehydrogenase electron transfer subunit, partial [Oligoflexia bacterium]|nr:dihydroorotate dehydrogenase electron transfer subunit [Oligoflexia bacterium]